MNQQNRGGPPLWSRPLHTQRAPRGVDRERSPPPPVMSPFTQAMNRLRRSELIVRTVLAESRSLAAIERRHAKSTSREIESLRVTPPRSASQ